MLNLTLSKSTLIGSVKVNFDTVKNETVWDIFDTVKTDI